MQRPGPNRQFELAEARQDNAAASEAMNDFRDIVQEAMNELAAQASSRETQLLQELGSFRLAQSETGRVDAGHFFPREIGPLAPSRMVTAPNATLGLPTM